MKRELTQEEIDNVINNAPSEFKEATIICIKYYKSKLLKRKQKERKKKLSQINSF